MTGSLLPTYEMIDIGALALLAFIVVTMVTRIWSGALDFPSFRRTGSTASSQEAPRPDLVRSLLSVLVLDVGTSRPLKTCDKLKWSSHVMIFWGFVFTAIATTLAFFMKPEGAVLPLTSPVKLFGNAGGLLLVVGCAAMFTARYQESGSMWSLHRSDYFTIALLLTAVSGFLTENSIYAFGREGSVTPYVYWTHMAIIVSLLATAPYTKFTHAFYKPSWILRQKIQGEAEAPAIPLTVTESSIPALTPPSQEKSVG